MSHPSVHSHVCPVAHGASEGRVRVSDTQVPTSCDDGELSLACLPPTVTQGNCKIRKAHGGDERSSIQLYQEHCRVESSVEVSRGAPSSTSYMPLRASRDRAFEPALHRDGLRVSLTPRRLLLGVSNISTKKRQASLLPHTRPVRSRDAEW